MSLKGSKWLVWVRKCAYRCLQAHRPLWCLEILLRTEGKITCSLQEIYLHDLLLGSITFRNNFPSGKEKRFSSSAWPTEQAQLSEQTEKEQPSCTYHSISSFTQSLASMYPNKTWQKSGLKCCHRQPRATCSVFKRQKRTHALRFCWEEGQVS